MQDMGAGFEDHRSSVDVCGVSELGVTRDSSWEFAAVPDVHNLQCECSTLTIHDSYCDRPRPGSILLSLQSTLVLLCRMSVLSSCTEL